jgi:glycosyltransferase involved in cell wall biosynthesis
MSALGYTGPRVQVAIIANAPAPYRVHIHERIVSEMPDVALTSVFLASENIQAWTFGSLSHIGAMNLGPGRSLNDARTATSLWSDVKRGVTMIRELRRRGTRAMVVSGYSSIECLMAIVWGRLAGVPVFLTSDSNIAGDMNSGLKRLAKAALVRSVVRLVKVVMPCGQMGRAYFKKYGARDESMRDYPYMADPAGITDVTFEQVENAMAKYGLDPDRKRMVCSGRLVHIKGFDLAIDAFNAVADERTDWDLVIAGDGELRQELEARVRPDLRARVIWTGFIADQADLAAVYRASHVLVHPSRREPWGVVINEAVTAKMAVIASDVTGAAADLVEDGVNGYIVPTDNLPALIEAMQDTTLPVRLSQFRRSAEVKLEDWYAKSDAVMGLRKALRSVGALSDTRLQPGVLQPALARIA